jgi:hypothetical protein
MSVQRTNITQIIENREEKVTKWCIGTAMITDQQIKSNTRDHHLLNKPNKIL